IPIVVLTGLFTGMVLALQSSVELANFGADIYIGNLVGASMVRELGPVLCALMVAGRSASGIAAELGSMRVTEQIDALQSFGTDPIKKLVTPRLLAGLVMLPILTVIADLIGIVGGMVIALFRIGMTADAYFNGVLNALAEPGFVLGIIPKDFVTGRLKPFVFGVLRPDPGGRLLHDAGTPRRARAGVMMEGDGVRIAHDDPFPAIRRELAEDREQYGDPQTHGAVIRLEDVHLTFEEPILSGVSLEARRGETLMVAGESGSGKSTILKLILRLLVPDSGRIEVLGRDVIHLTFEEALDLRRHIGMVFQNAALFDSMTIFENVAYPLRENRDLEDDELERIVRERLEFVDLEPERVMHQLPSQLSGGMRKRV